MAIFETGGDIPPPRQMRSVEGSPAIELSRDPVTVRGEPLGELWWRARQWAVTARSIECLDGTYFIDKKRLLEGWPRHV